MQFTHKKLAPEAAPNLRVCPIRTVAPFALMLAPVYVFMKMNSKFVSVKAPLDFFTPEELDRLKPFETFYIPEFVDSALPFREAARKIKGLMLWDPGNVKTSGIAEVVAADADLEFMVPQFPEAKLPPAPYELSDAILRIMGPLWGFGAVIEPFFISIFANEICELLPGEVMKQAREKSVELFERGIFRSGLAVFLALHLGFCEVSFLNRLRLQVFKETLDGVHDDQDHRGEVGELIELVFQMLPTAETRILKGEFFGARADRIARKIAGRMERISKICIHRGEEHPSIYGPKGFIDV